MCDPISGKNRRWENLEKINHESTMVQKPTKIARKSQHPRKWLCKKTPSTTRNMETILLCYFFFIYEKHWILSCFRVTRFLKSYQRFYLDCMKKIILRIVEYTFHYRKRIRIYIFGINIVFSNVQCLCELQKNQGICYSKPTDLLTFYHNYRI